MYWLDDWKTLQGFGNEAFRQQQLDLAKHYYLHSVLQLKTLITDNINTALIKPDVRFGDQVQQLTELIICLSIAMQNLAETYSQQARWQRCHRLLKKALQRLALIQQLLPEQHPAHLALLQESCSLRRELGRHSLACSQCFNQQQLSMIGLQSSSIH